MSTSRIVGVDAARGVALIGMIVAHAAPRGDEEWIVDGRSALLFATLAGVSLGLLTGGPHPTHDRRRARAFIAVRALVLLVLGIVLWVLPTDIAIILDYYGVMFLLLVPLVFLSRIMLVILAAVLFAGAPIAAGLLGPWATGVVADPHPEAAEVMLWLVVDRTLTGYYPALMWLPILLVGLIAARSDLVRGGVQLALAAGAVAAMALGYGTALVVPGVDASAHSSTHAELLGSGGFALAITVACIYVCAWRPARLVLAPVVAMGAMPLTVYTGQIVVIAVVTATAGVDARLVDYEAWPFVAVIVVGSAAFALGWRRVVGRGPLEAVVRRVATPRG